MHFRTQHKRIPIALLLLFIFVPFAVLSELYLLHLPRTGILQLPEILGATTDLSPGFTNVRPGIIAPKVVTHLSSPSVESCSRPAHHHMRRCEHFTAWSDIGAGVAGSWSSQSGDPTSGSFNGSRADQSSNGTNFNSEFLGGSAGGAIDGNGTHGGSSGDGSSDSGSSGGGASGGGSSGGSSSGSGSFGGGASGGGSSAGGASSGGPSGSGSSGGGSLGAGSSSGGSSSGASPGGGSLDGASSGGSTSGDAGQQLGGNGNGSGSSGDTLTLTPSPNDPNLGCTITDPENCDVGGGSQGGGSGLTSGSSDTSGCSVGNSAACNPYEPGNDSTGDDSNCPVQDGCSPPIYGPGANSHVPEPFTLTLFGAGLVVAAAARRRRKPA